MKQEMRVIMEKEAPQSSSVQIDIFVVNSTHQPPIKSGLSRDGRKAKSARKKLWGVIYGGRISELCAIRTGLWKLQRSGAWW